MIESSVEIGRFDRAASAMGCVTQAHMAPPWRSTLAASATLISIFVDVHQCVVEDDQVRTIRRRKAEMQRQL